jgi:hypothetical protein
MGSLSLAQGAFRVWGVFRRSSTKAWETLWQVPSVHIVGFPHGVAASLTCARACCVWCGVMGGGWHPLPLCPPLPWVGAQNRRALPGGWGGWPPLGWCAVGRRWGAGGAVAGALEPVGGRFFWALGGDARSLNRSTVAIPSSTRAQFLNPKQDL